MSTAQRREKFFGSFLKKEHSFLLPSLFPKRRQARHPAGLDLSQVKIACRVADQAVRAVQDGAAPINQLAICIEQA
jgi:hypothetical protein